MKAGDVIIVPFPGAILQKLRPAVILSTDRYHATRPDLIAGLITSQRPTLLTPSDCALNDWLSAGLRTASYFRLYLYTFRQTEVRTIGYLSKGDWESVRRCMAAGLGL